MNRESCNPCGLCYNNCTQKREKENFFARTKNTNLIKRGNLFINALVWHCYIILADEMVSSFQVSERCWQQKNTMPPF